MPDHRAAGEFVKVDAASPSDGDCGWESEDMPSKVRQPMDQESPLPTHIPSLSDGLRGVGQ
jgi:hypothetical protein